MADHNATTTEDAVEDAFDLLDAALDPEREEPWRYVLLAQCELEDVVDDDATDVQVRWALDWIHSAADLSTPQPWSEVRRARNMLKDVGDFDPEAER